MTFNLEIWFDERITALACEPGEHAHVLQGALVEPQELLQGVKEFRMVHQGRRISADRLDLEMPSADSERGVVFASVTTRAKIPGLGPNDTDVEVVFKIEGKWYRISEASVFDVDLHSSGETILQIMGKLEPIPVEAGGGL